MKYCETDRLELKREVNDTFKKEIVAFANSDGGEILIGVLDDGSILGIDNPVQEMDRISSMIRDGIRPDLTAYTALQTISEDGKDIIRLSVSRGDKRPYHLRDKGLKPGGVFVRHGTASVPAGEDLIRQMIREADGTTFDKARSVNQELTFQYTAAYFVQKKISFTPENQRSLGLIDGDGYFTNAAFLLSDQCDYSIKCAVYNGCGKTKFKSRKETTGSVLKQLEEAYTFLDLNNNVGSDFDRLSRIDHYSYPPYALREALLNTIVHRDYDYSGSTLINVFDDRVEFLSIGGLVKGITLTDIMRGISQSRNMILSSVFYRLDLIESYGTGIQRIIEAYEGFDKQPEFMPGPASFVAVLPNMNFTADIQSVDVDDLQMPGKERVLRLLQQKGKILRKDVEALLGCSAFPARNILKEIVEEGYAVRVGKGRTTQYVLKK